MTSDPSPHPSTQILRFCRKIRPHRPRDGGLVAYDLETGATHFFRADFSEQFFELAPAGTTRESLASTVSVSDLAPARLIARMELYGVLVLQEAPDRARVPLETD